MLTQMDEERAELLMKQAQQDAKSRWSLYEQMAAMHYDGTDGNGKAALSRRARWSTRPRGRYRAQGLLEHASKGLARMIDLSTTYLGLQLQNPLVASASPLSKKVEQVRQLEEAGVSAVVMYSLFEEQIIHESLELDHNLSRSTNSSPEAHELSAGHGHL